MAYGDNDLKDFEAFWSGDGSRLKGTGQINYEFVEDFMRHHPRVDAAWMKTQLVRVGYTQDTDTKEYKK